MLRFCLCLIFLIPVHADLVTPDYELKLFLDNSKVLQPNSMNLQAHVAKFFAIQDTISLDMQFLDTRKTDIYEQNWVVRIRSIENKPKLQISYKYRIPVTGTILAALQKAEELGWDSSETGYEYQVDWGYEKQTLSITKSVEKIEAAQLPSSTEARKMATKYIPGKLEKWGERYLGIEDWAKEILATAHIFGPVHGERLIGQLNVPQYGNIKIYIEIWDIAGTYVTELSCKVADFSQAEKVHRNLVEILIQQGWLLPQDVLKTTMIFNAYAR